jgi:hypothetical protein
MRHKFLSLALVLIFLSLLVFSMNDSGLSPTVNAMPSAAYSSPQESGQTETDYFNLLLSRDTQPLGLKENSALSRYLSQSSIKWAIRSGKRHILN